MVIMSNGLLHSGKGIEYMINAMPKVIERFPDALYVVQGKPHPTGWKVKEYYELLHKTVEDLELDDHVYFLEEFVSTPDLIELLRGVHIYVNPYVDHTQSVSGTLAMALSTGAAVVSTPYPYAEELLRKRDLGVLVPFRDSAALSSAVIRLFSNPSLLESYNAKAHAAAAEMTWARVGARYIELGKLM
mmetsp:Transcript_33501/g.57433  ORF Transcript_33501/g.57433 Transcript_33501/m.57433 type:complete len:188 (+) Transcript_33501:158-721(+)